jgi:hypothetical protein
MQMKHRRHFDAGDAASREAVQIGKMISDLDRLVRILDCDIATEEERARVFDRSDAAYPVLARTLAARRDNLRAPSLRSNSDFQTLQWRQFPS